MKLFYFFLLLLGFNFFVNAEQQEQWKLNIFDKNNNLSVVAMIILTESPTSTCLDGEWFDVDVKEAKKVQEAQFPVESQLSYRINNETLVLGRHNRCDSYAQLIGTLSKNSFSGEYSAFGLGWSKSLGTFNMTKVVL
jgi:thioredoxin-related protein